MLSIATLNYAAPPKDHFWKWSAGHDAVEWQDGRTLALWPEVHTVIESFRPRGGIPPMGAILMLLAACRDDWSEQTTRQQEAFAGLQPRMDGEAFEKLFARLDTIAALPRDLRSSMAAKCHLASLIFDGGPYSISDKTSLLILDELFLLGPRLIGDLLPELPAKARLLRDTRALLTALNRHDAESLENLLRTGLAETGLVPATLPDPLSESRISLEALATAGGEAGAAAAVARRAIAMIHFPGHLGTPPDLPVGGISDITNRGTIDHLLPGELAWDDLVLATRLVHNEALYFRREVPPMNVAVSHTVLLSRELRLWGQGRIFSLGVALGLSHHPALKGPGQTFECLAATMEDFEYLEFKSAAHVSAALQSLVPLDGPALLLEKWWDAARQLEDPAVPDVSLIVAKESLETPGLLPLLTDISAWIHHRNGHFRTLALGHEGELEIQEWRPGGIRPVFRGDVDLTKLLEQLEPKENRATSSAPPPPPQPVAEKLADKLRFYAEEPLPILLPLIPRGTAFLHEAKLGPSGHDGYLGISFDGRLMRYPELGWGGYELTRPIPGRQHWILLWGITPIVVASGRAPGEPVRTFRWDEGGLSPLKMERAAHSFPRQVSLSGEALILAYVTSAEAFSLITGQRIAELSFASLPSEAGFDYADGKLTLVGSGPSKPFTPKEWDTANFANQKLLVPDAAYLDNGQLFIRCGKTFYSFSPEGPTWEQQKLGSGLTEKLIPLSDSPLKRPDGTVLQIAAGPTPIYYDPSGILHLLDESTGDSCAILLALPQASVWHHSCGICSQNEHLREPHLPDRESAMLEILAKFMIVDT